MKKSHNVTGDHNGGKLTVEQENAIDLLVHGCTDAQAAEKAGVARETVTRWRNGNAYFLAELNRRRKEVWQASFEKLRSLGLKAAGVLEKELDAGNWKVAVEVLKSSGILKDIEPPNGKDDPDAVNEELLKREARTWAKQKVERETEGEELPADWFDRSCQRDKWNKRIDFLAEKRFKDIKTKNGRRGAY